MEEYKNIMGKILMILGFFIGITSILYLAFNAHFMLGILAISILMIFLGGGLYNSRE